MPSAVGGLANGLGANNCFVNSVVQLLFTLDDFRARFESLTAEQARTSRSSRVFTSLRLLFERLRDGRGSLSPDALRTAMAEAHRRDGKFKVSEMGDAIEFMELLLRRIEVDANTSGISPDRDAFPRSVFVLEAVRKGACDDCGAGAAVPSADDSILNLSVHSLIEAAMSAARFGEAADFGKLLKRVLYADVPLPCSRAACSKTVTATNVLLRAPPCLLFGLNWATASASASEIMELLDVIQLTLNLGDMYTNLDDRAHRGKYVYHLSGLVCYYGSHYALFTYNVEIQRWMMYDDEMVREVGPSWADVTARCKAGKWQPQLMVYVRRGSEIQPPSPVRSSSYAALSTLALPKGWGDVPFATTPSGASLYPDTLDMGGLTSFETMRSGLPMPFAGYGGTSTRDPSGYIPPPPLPRGSRLGGTTVAYDARSNYNARGDGQLDAYGGTVYSGAGAPAPGLDRSAPLSRSASLGGSISGPSTSQEPKSILDQVCTLVEQARAAERTQAYTTAYDFYRAAATGMMDVVEAGGPGWLPEEFDENRRKGISTARRYMELSDEMHRLARISDMMLPPQTNVPPAQPPSRTGSRGVYE
eukprot:m.150648 g.150648  ORF g.150648 m.150648 type:complete len:589 (+) comp14269_c0_seq2:115-1881(+)